MQFGWHYILDLAWIISHIDIPPGCKILDAGAGGGILQYLLAIRGYNVVSVDFSDRKIPIKFKPFFRFEEVNVEQEFQNEYIEHLKGLHGREPINKVFYPFQVAKKMFKKIRNINLGYVSFLLRQNKKINNFGKITLYKADFRKMDHLQSGLIDMGVSLSAIEHVPFETIPEAIKEFNRVLKLGGKMCVTTSAAKDKDWFHRPSRGWCFSEGTLRILFEFDDNTPSNWQEYETLFQKLKKSKEMKKIIPDFYFSSGNNGMPWGIWDPKYQPVGIIKVKNE